MQPIIRILAAISLFFFISCRPDTSLPLSTEVTDISSIRVQGYLFQDYQYGRKHQMVRVRIRNEKNLLIEIDSGAVYFHKWKMPFANYLFDTPQYELESYDKKLFYPDSTYKLTVMLSDSSKYYFYIHTPEKDLIQFNAPGGINSGQDISISWQEVCSSNPTRVKVEFDYLDGNSRKHFKKFLSIENPAEGHFKIPWSLFAPFKGFDFVDLELYYETEGFVDYRLLDNSYLRAQFKMKRSVSIR